VTLSFLFISDDPIYIFGIYILADYKRIYTLVRFSWKAEYVSRPCFKLFPRRLLAKFIQRLYLKKVSVKFKNGWYWNTLWVRFWFLMTNWILRIIAFGRKQMKSFTVSHKSNAKSFIVVEKMCELWEQSNLFKCFIFILKTWNIVKGDMLKYHFVW